MASRSDAMSMQLPQVEPAPVRIVSSATLVTPFSAASRIVVSVMPWQMQTNMGELGRPVVTAPFPHKCESLSIAVG